MTQRGGPWRIAGSPIPEGGVARASRASRKLDVPDRDRVLRWMVLAYVLAVVGGSLLALVGLSQGWW